MRDTEKEIEKLRKRLANLQADQSLRQEKASLEAKIQQATIDIKREEAILARKRSEPPELSVISPVQATKWAIGQPAEIRWASTGLLGNWVRIDLLRNGHLYREIAATAPIDTCSFSWLPPETLLPSDDYSVRLIGHLTGIVATSSRFKIGKI